MNQRSDKFEFLILIIVQFNSRFIQKIQKIQVHLTALEAMPAELPDPLPRPNVLFKKKRNRRYIGAKAIEENKKDAYYI
jgi:hypothetical protein